MYFDMETLSAQNRYKILTSTVTPRPIAWVTTLSEMGVVNAAPYSFFNVMGHEPPMVVIGVLGGKIASRVPQPTFWRQMSSWLTWYRGTTRRQ